MGVDLRFDVDAYVIIATDQLPNSDKIRQTITRGTRSYGAQEGKVFAIGDPNNQLHYERALLLPRGKKFAGGDRNLRILK